MDRPRARPRQRRLSENVVVSALAGLVDKGLMAPDWAEALAPVDDRVADMGGFLREEIAAGRPYLPAGDHVFRAFRRPLADVRVLIVGQDPYPTPGHPIGLCFAVDAHVRPIPRSLANIYQELATDVGVTPPPHGDLTAWTEQGVMLLNRVLTVRARPVGVAPRARVGSTSRRARSPRSYGARRPVRRSPRSSGAGTPGTLKPHLDPIPWVESAHPSPLSASRGFFGSRPFSRVNQLLAERGGQPVDWSLPME